MLEATFDNALLDYPMFLLGGRVLRKKLTLTVSSRAIVTGRTGVAVSVTDL